MNKKILLIIVLFLFINTVLSEKALPWKVNTHRDFSVYAIKSSKLAKNKGDYLKNLGFSDNVIERFEWNGASLGVQDWIAEGAEKEDAGALVDMIMGWARFYNHFHNPLETWSNAGLDDYITIRTPPSYDPYSFHFTGKSLLLWAQDDNNQNGFMEGDWTWGKIRDYYYDALRFPLESQRQEYFARMFRGLGQQMHLVQDSAQPNHVRNDAHPVTKGIAYEKWATVEYPNITSLISSTPPPKFPNVPFNISYNALVPVSQLIDAEQYDGSTPSASLTQGLAEYTNANFFSEDTIFAAERFSSDDRHYFPYPKHTSTDIQLFIDGTKPPETVTERDGGQDTNVWISKDKDGESDIPHFVKPRKFTRAIYNLFGAGDLFYRSFYYDETCLRDYSDKLIPRAVGYSAALLNYFFRGEIDIVESDARYKIENLSDEAMEGDLNAYKVFYDDANDYRSEITLKFYDEFGSEITSPSTILTIPPQSQSTFEIELQSPPVNPMRYILVFRGRLGNENDAVIGKVIEKRVYFVVLPADPVTRALSGKQYYYSNAGVMETITEDELLFELVDDGGYWNSETSDWSSNPDTESLKVPLSVGGPQYIAKHWDAANNRVRFIPNMSYEKNAYQAFHKTYYVDGASQQPLADFDYVTFQGNPILMFGAYQENPGYMEYTDTGLYSVRPVPASGPGERYFSEYHSANFIDTFLEYDTAKFYYFDGSPNNEQSIPKSENAPLTSVTAVSSTGNSYYISVPKIFDYFMPNPYWPSENITDGCSGVDVYLADLVGLSQLSTENKCASADNNCGFVHEVPGASSNEAEFDIPYNYNSWVHVINGNPDYYEELYINGQMVETSPQADRLETHYEILAVYKNIAVVRETILNSSVENPIGYRYQPVVAKEDAAIITPDVLDMVYSFVSNYYIYINGNRYNLSGQTFVESRILGFHYDNIGDNTQDPTQPFAWFLTGELVDDITGYHIDRIFISDTFDGNYVLVAFDEYAYNNGAGLVHDLNEVDTGLDTQGGDDKYFVYHDIPPEEIQGASHEALPSGRKLLLFTSDGTLEQSLQDPIGLGNLIGSIGILN